MIRRNYANIVSTVALVLALTAAGATAAPAVHKLLITNSKQIKNGVVKTQDIARNGVQPADIAPGAVHSSEIAPSAVTSSDVADGAVQSPDIAAGAVGSSDIADGSVTPTDVDLPAPTGITEQGVAVNDVGSEFAPVDPVGPFDKVDPASAVSITWTGSAGTGFSACVFQLRVDGQPSGGQVYVASGKVDSVTATALVEGLSAGQHQLDVYARTTVGATYPCTVGPSEVGIPQSFVIEEVVS